MADKIGTDPKHNPNQEYTPLDDEPMVFCEDENRKMPESDCTKIGPDEWYSKEFLSEVGCYFMILADDAVSLLDLKDDWRETGKLDHKKVLDSFYRVGFALKKVEKLLEKLGVNFDG
jgi:hypothetical protein